MRFSAHLPFVLFSVVLFLVQNGLATVIYVDSKAPSGGDGQSWTTAYRFLQDALADASNGDELWVASGVYKPDRSEANPTGTGLHTDTFIMTNGIRLYGGLAGTEDPQIFPLDYRDFSAHETILSGDLMDNDNHSLTGKDLLNDPNRSDNSYHVLKGTGITDSTQINGFTITGGHAMALSGEGTTGGGLLNSNNSNPQIFNCRFIRNTAQWGAAFYNYRSSNRVDNTCFVDNASILSGGAIHNGVSLVEMKLTNCVFENCFSEGWGGAVYNNNNAILRLEHCLLVNNKVWKSGNTRGGAIANDNSSQVTAEYCTFAGNIADNEGGAIRNDNSTLNLDGCILWDNEDETGKTQSAQIHSVGGTLSLEYTCMMGWDGNLGGVGNFGLDPLFFDLPAGDVHLQSQAGRWNPNTQTWGADAAHSPCIDAGDPNSDFSLEPAYNGKRINIGTYGGTEYASKSIWCYEFPLGDLNKDCIVNLVDYALFTKSWLECNLVRSEDCWD